MNIARRIQRTARHLGITYFDILCAKLKLSAPVNLLLGQPKTLERKTAYLILLVALTVGFALKAAFLSLSVLSLSCLFVSRLLAWYLSPRINVATLRDLLEDAVLKDNFSLVEDLIDCPEGTLAINSGDPHDSFNETIFFKAVQRAAMHKRTEEENGLNANKYAAKYKLQLKIIKLLIKNNADVETVNIYNQSVLHFARGELLRLLAPKIKRHAIPNATIRALPASTEDKAFLAQHKQDCLTNFQNICIDLSRKYINIDHSEEKIFLPIIQKQARYYFPGNLQRQNYSVVYATNIFKSVERIYAQRQARQI